MIRIRWTGPDLRERETLADFVKLWELTGPAEREHGPPGTVVEAYRGGIGVLQLDPRDRVGQVYIDEVKA